MFLLSWGLHCLFIWTTTAYLLSVLFQGCAVFLVPPSKAKKSKILGLVPIHNLLPITVGKLFWSVFLAKLQQMTTVLLSPSKWSQGLVMTNEMFSLKVVSKASHDGTLLAIPAFWSWDRKAMSSKSHNMTLSLAQTSQKARFLCQWGRGLTINA